MPPGLGVGDAWPEGVPVQVHGMDADPFFAGGDMEAARELVDSPMPGRAVPLPGGRAPFADSSLPPYDEAAAALLMERVLAFLDAV